MKLLFLGSSASESIPALWCECPNCRRAAELGGRNIRRRTSYLVDGSTLVDFGPDANWQMKEFKVDPAAVKRLLVTHSHVDHFNPEDLIWRGGGFSLPGRRIAFIANRAVVDVLDACRKRNQPDSSFDALGLDVTVPEPGKPFRNGEMEILPVRASHAPEECALNYVLTAADGSRLLVANDTGWWSEESWELLRGMRLDLAVIEISMGIRMPYAEERGFHLGARAAIAFRDRLAELGAVTASTQVAVTHISHHVGATHEELEAYFRPYGMRVGFDGMILEGTP